MIVGLPWGQLNGLLHFLNLLIISSWASLVILVLALILILQLINLAKLSLNLPKLKSLPLLIISSNIFFITSSSLPLGNQVGWLTTLKELIPNSSIWIFNEERISFFSLIIINSLTGRVIIIGTRGEIVSLVGWDKR